MKKRRLWRIAAWALAVLALLAAAFFIWAEDYYRAGDEALAALESGDVIVERTDYGWRFDGPSDEDALIFYPGAKVEAAAYAPMLRNLARQGVDACLVEMPLRLAFFDADAAERVIGEHDYARWYVGGHSLGGAMAATYAAENGNKLAGVVLCAAYPTRKLIDRLGMVTIYGTEDGVLNRDSLISSRQYAPAGAVEIVIEGGNHAQFGDYGPQKGDGEATVSAAEQRRQAVEAILEMVDRRKTA